MNEPGEIRIFPLGTLLIVVGGVLLALVVFGGFGFFAAGVTTELARIEEPGEHTMTLGRGGRLMFTRPEATPAGEKPGAFVIGMGGELTEQTTEAFAIEVLSTGGPTPDEGGDGVFKAAPDQAWLEIDHERFRVLGSVEAAAGDTKLHVAGGAADFPIIVRRHPGAVVQQTLTVAGGLLVPAVLLIVAGTAVCIRNGIRRSRAEAAMLEGLL